MDNLFEKLKINPNNPRTIKGDKFEKLKKSIKEFPQMLKLRPIVYDDSYIVLGGNMRLRALQELKNDGFEVLDGYFIKAEDLSEERKKEFIIKDNVPFGEWDDDMLANEWSDLPLEEWGIDTSGWSDKQTPEEAKKKLAERFIIPPFTVLDTRQGYWQDRRRSWLALGIESEAGRKKTLLGFSPLVATFGGGGAEDNTSVFDPVLCELAYKWFCVDKGKILDPFAGGSVRGVVANYLGYSYFGNDLSEEQVTENRKQAEEIVPDNKPTWSVGDSANIKELCPAEYDYIFSCPPYFDLEVYSEDAGELSAMDYAQFLKQYRLIIKDSVSMLKDNRFACFVVGDIRDKKGFYRNFISETISAFQDVGMTLYNEAILVNSVGSLPIRVGKQFTSGRKLGKCHQNVLVFYKGDPKEIKSNYLEIEVSGVDPQM